MRLCFIPELLGKWYTRIDQPYKKKTLEVEIEEETGTWCYCKEEKGGEMIGCNNKACDTTWFHLKCVGMNTIPSGKWLCPSCHVNSRRKTPRNNTPENNEYSVNKKIDKNTF